MQPILVTGADGFLGRAVAAELDRRGLAWRAAVRAPRGADGSGAAALAVGEVGPRTDWTAALEGAAAVIHLAAPAHEAAAANESALVVATVEGAARLARQARAAGVARLVLASSVKAMGEATAPDRPWTEADPCAPTTAYGRAKRDAERAVAAEWGAAAVSLRLPLVYGPGVRANLDRLLRAVRAGRPLPFGAVRNRRSMVGRANAAEALVLAATRAAPGGAWLVRDADWSTPELVRAIAEALQVRPRLWNAPPSLLRALAFAHAGLRRLTESLVVDDARFRAAYGWTPRCDPAEEWRRAAQALRAGSGGAPA